MPLVWCEALERNDASVLPGDIPLALESYRKRTGRNATMIYLNSKMKQQLEASVPEEIEVIEHNGVLSWEIQLDDDAGGNIGKTEFSPFLERPPAPPHQEPAALDGLESEKIPHIPHEAPGEKPFEKAILSPLASNQVRGAISELAGPSKLPQEIKKHAGGRPRKTGNDVSYSTQWRRRKRLQGVLI
jgi:hypothetical protein